MKKIVRNTRYELVIVGACFSVFRSTEEIFALFISMAFAFDAFKDVVCGMTTMHVFAWFYCVSSVYHITVNKSDTMMFIIVAN